MLIIVKKAKQIKKLTLIIKNETKARRATHNVTKTIKEEPSYLKKRSSDFAKEVNSSKNIRTSKIKKT